MSPIKAEKHDENSVVRFINLVPEEQNNSLDNYYPSNSVMEISTPIKTTPTIFQLVSLLAFRFDSPPFEPCVDLFPPGVHELATLAGAVE